MIKCEICNREYETRKSFSYHLRNHNITIKQYNELYQLDVQSYCKKCGKLLTKKNRKTDYCTTHRDRTGANNPFFGKTHTKETIESNKIKASKKIKTRWKDPVYRKKVIDGISKPRSIAAKINISNGVKQSYKNDPQLKQKRSQVMLDRIKNGFDPLHGRSLQGEGWGETGIFNDIYYVSKLEKKRLIFLCNNNIAVKGYLRSEFNDSICYRDTINNIDRTYFPDFILPDNKCVEEIKYRNSCFDIQVLSKYQAAFLFFKRINYRYYIVTERDFESTPDEIYNNTLNKQIRSQLNQY
jgi:hypothetical protein